MSSTRLSVPAYTRGGCSPPRTSSRGPGGRESSVARPTRAAPPGPSTKRAAAPRSRPATHSTAEPMMSVQPRAVITSAGAAGRHLHTPDGVGQHVATGDAAHLRFGCEGQAVLEHREGQFLEVVGDDVFTAERR